MNTQTYTDLEQALEAFYASQPQCFHPFLWHERQTLFAGPVDADALEDNTFALVGELLCPHMGFERSENDSRGYCEYICEQLYFFFTRKGYEEENLTACACREMLITTAAVSISQHTGLNAALVTAAVTLVVSLALKIGVRAWCERYADRHPEVKK